MEQLTLPGVEEHLKKHPLQPHQMSRAQYERDPQTMWRAEGSDTLGGSSTDWTSSGVHFGDYASARDRGEAIEGHGPPSSFLGPQGEWEDRPIRMFSLRTKGRFSNEPVAEHPAAEVLPQTKGVAPDTDIGGAVWPQYRTGRWYLNEAEGHKADTDRGPANTPMVRVGVSRDPDFDTRSSGTLSGYVPRREGFLTTHSEEVLKAHAEGKSVHPTILQQAQIGPEYSETIEALMEPPTNHPHTRKPSVRRLGRPEHPAKLFQTMNQYSSSPTYVSNEDYDEMLRKHHANKTGESNEPILSHIGESRPAGSSR